MLVALAFAALALVKGDLPIHCRRKWVYGEWTLKRGEANSGGVNNCGYLTPDKNVHHFSHKEAYEFKAVGKEILVELKKPNIVKCIEGCKKDGTFSMIYDEGMEIYLPDQDLVYFAFFSYRPKDGVNYKTTDRLDDYESDCTKTRTGWYHENEISPKKWGCASMHQTRANSPQCDSEGPSENATLPKLRSVSSRIRFKKVVTTAEALNAAVLERAGAGSTQSKILKIDSDAKFIYDHDWINAHNSNPDSLWKAKAYQQFEGMPLREAMNRLGSFRARVLPEKATTHHSHHVRGMSTNLHRFERSLNTTSYLSSNEPSSRSESNGLPEAFDWRERGIVTPIQDQGNCGSCYAQAALDVAAMRWKIAFPKSKEHFFSVDDHISNSFYNQGCQGGYPFLVGKHGKDIGFKTLECASDPKCKEMIMIDSYGYVGGYYGAGNEIAMMKEIHKNGPVVAAFEPTGKFFSYSSGVFTGEKGVMTDDWEKTDHAIVLVGWGVSEDGVKYWIGKNSWGSLWGDRGYFKIRRGTDETGIESMAMYLTFPHSQK